MINRILMVSSEAVPFAKSGGLADVAGTLPKNIVDNGYDMRVVMPMYKSIKTEYKKMMTKIFTFNVQLDWRNQTANLYECKWKTDQGNFLTYYFIQNDYYFERDGMYGYDDDGERFMFFSKAVLNMLPIIDFCPDIMHCNDWQTGSICAMLSEVYRKTDFYKDIKTVFTIHNLKFQGWCGKEFLNMMQLDDSYFVSHKLEFYGKVNMMKAGILYCDKLNTVSEMYAREIQTPTYGCDLEGLLREQNHKLYGILNGIDNDFYNPFTDEIIWKNYSIEKLDRKSNNKLSLQRELGFAENVNTPLISIVSRLTDQKGLDLIGDNIEELLGMDIQLVILGTGDRWIEEMFSYMETRAPHKVKAHIMFSEEYANKLYAASDMILIPSRFEPCGLTQLISFRYGTVPIARATGGLADTVINYKNKAAKATGFTFRNASSSELMDAVRAAYQLYTTDKSAWTNIVTNIMKLDYSWNSSAKKYIRLYETIQNKKWQIA